MGRIEHQYSARRRRLAERAGDGPILVRGAASGGTVNPNLRYLTGIDEPGAALLMDPGGLAAGFGALHPGPDYYGTDDARELLFLPRESALASRWGDGPRVSFEAMTAAPGELRVADAAELPRVLSRALARRGRLAVVRSTDASLLTETDADARFVATIRERFFGAEIRDATPLVHEARRLKERSEVAAIEAAAAVTATALVAVRAGLAAGVRECEIEAEITACYRRAGAFHAFDPIVGGGRNATVLHYTANDARLEANALVLVDTGARLDGYHSDVSRTYPVSGRFTTRQAEVYGAVLEAQKRAIDACRPGNTLGDVHRAAWRSLDARGLADAFVHGIGHHLGLATHDVGSTEAPLAAGAVLTVEPGVYLPDEAIGVRIEDDVLVTDDGPRVLTAEIPKEVAALETPS